MHMEIAAAFLMVLLISFNAVAGSSGSINSIVSKDRNSGNYTTVGEAIGNAPEFSQKPYIIHVLAGIYQEYILIPSTKINIHLFGDGPNHTIILANQNGSTIGTLYIPSCLISILHVYLYSPLNNS